MVAVPDRCGSRAARARPRRSSSSPATIELFPAWETLPFERVSPSLETMGRRLRVMWRLRSRAAAGDRGRAGAGAGAAPRARTSRTSSRSSVRPGDRRRPRRARRAARRRWATGASTRWRRGARSRCAARSSTSTRRPTTTRCASTSGATRSTGSSAFSVADQRSTHDVDEALDLPGARAAAHRPRCAARAAALVRDAAVGARAVGAPRRGPGRSTAWSRGCRGSPSREHLLPDLLPADALVLARRAAPHARPRRRSCSTTRPRSPTTLATTWGATASSDAARASRCRSTGCSRTPTAGATSRARDARGARHAAARRHRVRSRRRRHRERSRAGSAQLARRRLPRGARGRRRGLRGPARATCSPRTASTRTTAIAPGRDRHRRRAARARRRGRRRAARARRRGRPHRPAARAPARRAARAQGADFYDDLKPGDYVVHHHARRRPLRGHGHARDRWRRARLPAARVQGRRQALRARPTRSARCAGTPAATRRRSTAWAAPTCEKTQGAGARRGARDRAGARRAVPPAARDARATRSRPTRRGSARSRRRSPRGDARPARRRSTRSRPTWSAPSRWTGSCAATSASARPRSRCAPRSRRCRTASRWRSSCRRRCSPTSTARRSASASRTTRCGSRCSRGS